MKQFNQGALSMVSVCMITYNHEKFVSEAIKSILMQKTNFYFQLIIGEDCSNDNTRLICKDFEEKYSSKIRLLDRNKNLGMIPNFISTLKECNGKYIALCEGDDYWTDPFKLQKQVDFLENNDNYVISFHNSSILDTRANADRQLLLDPKSLTVQDIFSGKIIPTQTVVFRNIDNNYPAKFLKVYNGDTFLFCWLASKSGMGAYYQNDIGNSIYRLHDGGNWSEINFSRKYSHSFNTMKIIFNEFPKYRNELAIRIQQMQLEYIHKETSKAKRIYFTMKLIIFSFAHFRFGLGFLVLKRIVK